MTDQHGKDVAALTKKLENKCEDRIKDLTEDFENAKQDELSQ